MEEIKLSDLNVSNQRIIDIQNTYLHDKMFELKHPVFCLLNSFAHFCSLEFENHEIELYFPKIFHKMQTQPIFFSSFSYYSTF